METVVANGEMFGSEHKLVHQAVSTGLSVGAGQVFWSKLANNQLLFRQAVELVEGAKEYVQNGYFVFRTTGKSLIDIWDANQDLFFLGGDHWWKDELFANAPGVQRNVALFLDVVPGSRNKLLHEQRQLLRAEEVVPSATEVVEGLILHYKLTGQRALQDLSVRTSDTTRLGGRVDIGIFKPDGMVVDYYWDDWNKLLGLAAAKYLG